MRVLRMISRRRVGALMAMLGVATTLSSVLGSPRAGAVLSGSNFESNDANLSVDTPGNMDWNGFAPVTWTGTAPYRQSTATVGGWTFTGLEDGSKSKTDTGFAGGTKQNQDCPAVIGSIAPNKDDLARVYLATETINGHVFLSLAWSRIPLNSTTTSTHVAFEFNQGTAGACPSSSGGLLHRVDGDLLISYDFAGGTASPTLGLQRWTTTGACQKGATGTTLNPPCWGAETTPLPASIAEAAVNTGANGLPSSVVDCIAPPGGASSICTTRTGGVSLGTLQFGEAGIDLTNAGVFTTGPAAPCLEFGSTWAVTRTSGNSTDAAMEDLVGPGNITLTNCVTKTFNVTFNSGSPPIAGTSVYAVYTTPDGTTHSLLLTQNGSTYTGADPDIHPNTTLTGVHLEIRNADGTVAWRTSPDQTETITANTTNSATFGYTLSLSPHSAENFVGKPHTFTATVTGTGTFNKQTTTAPLVGVTVNFATFSGTPSGCGSLSSASSATDANGEATTILSSATPCTTSLRAWINAVGGTAGFDNGEVSDTATKTFVAYSVTITPSSATNVLGTNHTFTVTLTRDTGAGPAADPNQLVSLSIADPNNTGAYLVSINGTPTNDTTTTSGTCTTKADGTCAVVATAPRTGTFTLNASFTTTNDSGQGTFTGSGTKTFEDFRITVTPATSTNVVGTNHTFTVTLQRDSGSGFVADAGQTLSLSLAPGSSDAHFTSINGSPASGTTGSCVTAADGTCSVVILATTPGLVTLTATYSTTLASGTLTRTGTATKQYSSFALAVTPLSATNPLGVAHTFTVTLTRNDGSGAVGYAGQTIGLSLDPGTTQATFTMINGSTASGTTGSCVTTAIGTCSVTIVGTAIGTATLTATYSTTLDSGPLKLSSKGDKTYISPPTVTKTPCAPSAPPNGVLSFDIPWKTTGSTLTNAVITDDLPSQLLFESATPAPTQAPTPGQSGNVVFSLGTLTDPGQGKVTVVVAIDPATPLNSIITNSGTLTADGGIDVPFSATADTSSTLGSDSGRAFAAQLNSQDLIPGRLDVTSGSDSLASLAAPPAPATPVVTAGLLTVSNIPPTPTATGASDDAQATTANVDVELTGVSVKAAVVAAHSSSSASGTTANSDTSGSEVTGLVVNGTTIGNVTSPRVIPVLNALGVEIAEVDVLETYGGSGAAASVPQPAGTPLAFSSGLDVNGLHVKLLSGAADVVVSHAESQASSPALSPCAAGHYVVGNAFILNEVLTGPTTPGGPTTATVLEGNVNLPSTGGHDTSTVDTATLQPVGATSGTGTADTKGDIASAACGLATSTLDACSTATVQSLVIPGLSATAVSSSATANSPNTPSGTTTILGLSIGGMDVCSALGGQVKKTCTPAMDSFLLDQTGTLVIELNEQIVTPKQITVNAVHITVLGAGNPLGLPVGSELILSSSTAGTS